MNLGKRIERLEQTISTDKAMVHVFSCDHERMPSDDELQEAAAKADVQFNAKADGVILLKSYYEREDGSIDKSRPEVTYLNSFAGSHGRKGAI